jgi:hypothetical protein
MLKPSDLYAFGTPRKELTGSEGAQPKAADAKGLLA